MTPIPRHAICGTGGTTSTTHSGGTATTPAYTTTTSNAATATVTTTAPPKASRVTLTGLLCPRGPRLPRLDRRGSPHPFEVPLEDPVVLVVALVEEHKHDEAQRRVLLLVAGVFERQRDGDGFPIVDELEIDGYIDGSRGEQRLVGGLLPTRFKRTL